eukprot:GFUD01073863.1.p1 GENE.GFUD01073863.1~~GFUD01073863.1.p1  ORF type:complete len:170 (+),score=56.54 GFUD01073863.1:90-599(+)
MAAKDYISLRLNSEIHEEDCDYVDREVEETRLARRRWITIVTIAAVFLVSAVILLISVVHDVQARNRGDLEWEEFSCQQNDLDCLALLCPDGMSWDMVAGKCKEVTGYTCCTACTQEYKCFTAEEAQIVKCCYAEGVVPSAYKQVCRQGYLWVQWKKKCLRKNKENFKM